MVTLRKFVNGLMALVGIAVLGAVVVRMAPAALDQASPETRATVAGITVQLESLSHSAGLFVDRNVTTARLQIAGMANSIPTSVADLLPTNALNWAHGGAQVAAQNAGAKAGELARKVPVVNSALNSTSNRFAAVRSSLSSAAGF
jgi:hypothetical protein